MAELFRPELSFDINDLATLIVGLIAVYLWYRLKRLPERRRVETVDSGVLEQFRQLFTRIATLEVKLSNAEASLETAICEIKEMRKLEEFLQAKVHDRDKQIQALTNQLALARARIQHLEDVCRRAGINGEGEKQ